MAKVITPMSQGLSFKRGLLKGIGEKRSSDVRFREKKGGSEAPAQRGGGGSSAIESRIRRSAKHHEGGRERGIKVAGG